jgi:hypothetical protein
MRIADCALRNLKGRSKHRLDLAATLGTPQSAFRVGEGP